MADIINFYEELGVGRDDSIAQIHAKLRELKQSLGKKLGPGRSSSQHWERQLELASQAEAVFADEDSRDRYDIELDRAEVSDAPVNWTTRAWNYYFIGDNGAAMVAARKAKEQSPTEAMPFVVSAWVLLSEDEPRQAKHDADEAFVLDELTTDSVDVQEVRGTVYLVLEQYDRALASFDKALAKAADGEKPELYWRRALTYEGMGNAEEAYVAGCTGISQHVDISDHILAQLELVISNAIHLLATRPDPEDTLNRYAHYRNQIATSLIGQQSKIRIVNNIDENSARWERLKSLQDQCARDAKVPAPSEDAVAVRTMSVTGIGCVSLVILAFGGLMSFVYPAVGIITLALVGGGIFAYIASQRSKQGDLARVREAYSQAQSRLAANEAELRNFRPDPIRLKPELGR